LWRGGGINNKKGLSGGGFMRLVPSAVVSENIALVCGPKQSAAIGYRMDATGDISTSGRAWTFDEKNTPDTCTPAALGGKFYVFNGDKQVMTCLDAKTGTKVWQESFGLDRSAKGSEIFRASPTIADGEPRGWQSDLHDFHGRRRRHAQHHCRERRQPLHPHKREALVHREVSRPRDHDSLRRCGRRNSC
jgi:hypothetical protein